MDKLILEYGNPTAAELRCWKAVEKYGSGRKAAKHLGITHPAVNQAIRRIKRKAALRGYAPEADMTHTAAEPFGVTGTSTLYNRDGEPVAQWVKTAKTVTDEEWRETLIEGFTSALKKLAKPVPAPRTSDSSSLVVYGIGDAHCGLYAWGQEAEENFDLTQWEQDLVNAMHSLVATTPRTEEALIVNVGDFIHSDNLQNRTAKAGNVLDVDGRWPKVLQTAVMAMRKLIELALKKHKHVTIINAQGNHDEQSSIALTIALQMYYENEPRVTVQTNWSKFHMVEFGKNLIAVTHSDTVKISQLESLMASMWPEEWGRTEHRYWLVGHQHHRIEQEFRGCDVLMLRSLVASDAWHWGSGYRGRREMMAITYHKEYGESFRNTCSIKLARKDGGSHEPNTD